MFALGVLQRICGLATFPHTEGWGVKYGFSAKSLSVYTPIEVELGE